MSNVISEKRQRSTLRAGKARKPTLKNVLASPYTHYWPLLKDDDDRTLKRTLTIASPNLAARRPKVNIPWKEIKGVPKERRGEYRRQRSQSVGTDPGSKYMYCGVNEVTRLLERDLAVAVLLSGDVAPQMMIKHVVDSCVYKKVPVLVVPEFKTFLMETLGINAAAIAFCEDSKIDPIKDVIKEIFTKYPVPESHQNLPKEEFFKSVATNERKPKQEVTVKNVHLYRDGVTSRVFTPGSSKRIEQIRSDKMEVDFMRFNDDVKGVDSYKSLVVKRISGDPNRSKRKLGQIKSRNRRKKQKVA